MSQRTDQQWVAALRGEQGRTELEAAYRDLGTLLNTNLYTFLLRQRPIVPGLYDQSDDQLRDLAEELTQTTLHKTAYGRLLDLYLWKASFPTYIIGIALMEARQELRKSKWQYQTLSLPTNPEEMYAEKGVHLPNIALKDSHALSPETQAVVNELWQAIKRCFEGLNKRYQIAFYRRVWEEQSIEEVMAQMQETSRQNIYNTVLRARKQLKECLAGADWPPDAIWQLFDEPNDE